MTENANFRQIASSVCAIGYFPKGAQASKVNPVELPLEIVGTGFIVGETTVLTNRHVIQDVQKALNKLPAGRLGYLQFSYPRGNGGWQTAQCQFKFGSYPLDDDLDIAFVEFERQADAEFAQCVPVEFGKMTWEMVGQAVAVYGYPYGNRLIMRRKRLFRFGPVLQQGFVSAIGPYNGSPIISDLLLDIRAAPGMSGSPVFLPDSGEVIGVVHSTIDATTTLALPIDRARAASLLRTYREVTARN